MRKAYNGTSHDHSTEVRQCTTPLGAIPVLYCKKYISSHIQILLTLASLRRNRYAMGMFMS